MWTCSGRWWRRNRAFPEVSSAGPWSVALWPMVTSEPTDSGMLGSACKTHPSCTLLRAPTTMVSRSVSGGRGGRMQHYRPKDRNDRNDRNDRTKDCQRQMAMWTPWKRGSRLTAVGYSRVRGRTVSGMQEDQGHGDSGA